MLVTFDNHVQLTVASPSAIYMNQCFPDFLAKLCTVLYSWTSLNQHVTKSLCMVTINN